MNFENEYSSDRVSSRIERSSERCVGSSSVLSAAERCHLDMLMISVLAAAPPSLHGDILEAVAGYFERCAQCPDGLNKLLVTDAGKGGDLVGWLVRRAEYDRRSNDRTSQRRHRILRGHVHELRVAPVPFEDRVVEQFDGEPAAWPAWLNDLSEQDRQVIVEVYVEGTSYAELAARYSSTAAALRKRASRGIRKIRRQYDGGGAVVALAG